MTEEELKQTGKSGVYRADLDQWFIEGEEPPLVPAAEPALFVEPAESIPAAPLKTTKPVKNHD